MAEPTQILFKFTEIAEMMVKQQGIHEGNWLVLLKFGIGAANAPVATGELRPTALVPVMDIGLQKTEEPNPLSVDAAVVNPRPGKQKKPASTKNSKAK